MNFDYTFDTNQRRVKNMTFDHTFDASQRHVNYDLLLSSK